MATDSLAMQGARASATMILTQLTGIIQSRHIKG